MRRLALCSIAVLGASLALGMALGACGDSCVDTGCVQIDSGPDVKAEAGKKDVATDAPSDGADASRDAADASNDAAIE